MPHAPASWLGARAAILLPLLLAGCSTTQPSGWSRLPPGPDYRPANIFCAAPHLPSYVRRAAVLPISVPEQDWQAAHGSQELQRVLLAELGKAQRFEVVAVSPESLRALSGRPAWRPEEPMPHDLAARLRAQFGCEALLLAHLQPYHAYQPLKIGWNLKLVDLEARQIVWAADELFDAAHATVARAAQRYAREHGGAAGEDALVLQSPRRFGQFTLAALFATLPKR